MKCEARNVLFSSVHQKGWPCTNALLNQSLMSVRSWYPNLPDANRLYCQTNIQQKTARTQAPNTKLTTQLRPRCVRSDEPRSMDQTCGDSSQRSLAETPLSRKAIGAAA